MMIANTCLVVTLLVLNHGQSGNSHVVTVRQATDSLKNGTPRISVGEGNDHLEINEGSGIMATMLNVGECRGGDEEFDVPLQNPSGCYIFQTTGFNLEGYPNNIGPLNPYWCDYYIRFGGTKSGTVTVKEKDFQFQVQTGELCDDYVAISGVNDEQQENDGSDSEDRDLDTNIVRYCDTITGDKIRDFSNSELRIRLAADRTENGNGAEILICID